MRLILLVFLVFFSFYSEGQKNTYLTIIGESSQQIKRHPETAFKDSAALFDYLSDFQHSAVKKGYLIASFDSIKKSPSGYDAHFFLGPQFEYASLRMAPHEMEYLRKSGNLSEKVISHSPITPTELSALMRKVHNTYLNDGYPFSSVQLDSVTIGVQSIDGLLRVERGPLVEWQKINIRGDSTISEKYVSNLIGIQPGDYYKESDLRGISNRIRQVNFLKEIKPADVLFTKEGAELFIYLESKPISSVNGIVGLQPDPATSRMIITGELNLKLINILKRGELLDINWRSIQPQTQSLKAHVNYPFLFRTPFGIDGKFNLYKRDSTFLELVTTVGVNYFLKGGNYIKAFYQNSSSNLLSGSNSLPAGSNLASVSSNSYGLAFYRRQLDYVPNPSQGLVFNIESSVGSRKSRITDTSEVVNSTIYRGSIEVESYLPITRRHVIKLRNLSQFYYAPVIFANEVHRFGGLQSQRGFNEEELYSTTSTTFTLEYRFLVDQNSHAFAFFDQTWYENTSGNYIQDHPYGFGVGFAFGTNFGIFSISYALGQQFNNPILLRNGKIHFGYIAYF